MKHRILSVPWALAGLAGLSLAAAAGCAGVPASTMTFENTTRPVSIGPVDRLGGAPADAPGDAATTRSVEAVNLYRFNSGAYGGGTVTRQTEGPGKFDVEAEHALESCPTCRIRLDGIRVGSHSAVLIGLSDDTHWTGTELVLFERGSKK